MKPKIFIRADGSKNIGLGHLVRCTALAYMLKNDFEISFFCVEIPESISEEIYNSGFGLVELQNENQFFEQLIQKPIVVLDGYHFDTDYQKRIKSKGCKLVCIDDLHEKEFVADLIINHAPGIIPQDYCAQSYTQFALGLEYALLRPAFLEQAKKTRKIDKVETILISFGGSDFLDLTQQTLRIVLEFAQFKTIIVVTGASYNKSESFQQLITSDMRIKHRHAINEQQMLETMLEAELAIVPASGVLFEALAAGLSLISGYYTNNQLSIYNGFNQKSWFFDAENFSDIKSTIMESLKGELHPRTITIDGLSDIG
jgi:UDP-2,4-diacetamido-2,4,6-trideoxy-beta-L-altropyranose hydrolase